MSVLLLVLIGTVGISAFAGMAIGGVWLAVLGSWSQIGWGLLFEITYFVSMMTIGSSVAALLWGITETCRYAKKRAMMYLSAFISFTFLLVLIGGWCWFVLYFFLHGVTDHNLMPSVLWAYGVATVPFFYATQALRGRPVARDGIVSRFRMARSMTMTVAWVGCLVTVLLRMFSSWGLPAALSVFVWIMCIGVGLFLPPVAFSADAANETDEASS